MLRRVTGLPIHVVTKDPTELDEIADPLRECVNRTVVDIEVVVNEDIAETGQAAGPLMKIRGYDTGPLEAVENAAGIVRGSKALLGHDVVADIKQALHGNLEVTLRDHPRIRVRQVLATRHRGKLREPLDALLEAPQTASRNLTRDDQRTLLSVAGTSPRRGPVEVGVCR